MVFLNSECKYFFALMRLTDGCLSISHSFQTQMRQKPFFSYILSTYQHILISVSYTHLDVYKRQGRTGFTLRHLMKR